MGQPPPNVPAHLRQLVVEQDYRQYNAVDQAVWRFVLLQMHSRLALTAHPAYRDGLRKTGLSVERIPNIAEMNDCLAQFGWGAVCVDGFIPPRSFQEFQAAGILPIAADIRTLEHLVYTPAPDIIHEAAGHAPILPDPLFSAYLRRIGEMGKTAFTFPEEDRIFRAIYTLSEVMENLGASTHDAAVAQDELRLAVTSAVEPSEAARLSRLYWWTAEYGLVGRIDDYKLYGAGLLSSLGESHSCHDPEVRKLPLDESCLDVSYDITRRQPQLFVVRDFDALHDLLDRVARTLAVTLGGAEALSRALRSQELGSVQFSSGLWVIGTLRDAGPGLAGASWLDFEGPVAFAWDGTIALEHLRPPRQCVLVGRLEGGHALERTSDAALARLADGPSGRHRFRFASGARVEGRLERTARHADGRLMHVELRQARVELPGSGPRELEHFTLLAAGDVVTARAGAVDPTYHAKTPFSSKRVPAPRDLPQQARSLLLLFEQAQRAHGAGSREVEQRFPLIHASLERDFPQEWLLRWNLLETLLKIGQQEPIARRLRQELEELENLYEHREPIATGLRYLMEEP